MRAVMNLATLLTQTARRFPDRPGLVQGERRFTWRALDAEVDAMVAALGGLGVARGDRVLVISRNNPEMFLSMFACWRLGAVWVPVNFRQAPAEIAYNAAHSGALAMIYEAGFEAHVDAARAASPALRHVVSIGAPRDGEHGWAALAEANRGSPAEPAAVDRDDPLWFFYTSGTTGRPKAAVLTHGQMTFVVTNHLADLVPGTTEEDASLVVAPLSHASGLHALTQVARGAVTVLMPGERLDVPTAWRLVEKWRVTNMFTVPTILKMLVEDPSVDAHDHSSLRYVIYAGSPMYREDQKRALAKLGPVIVQYYGLGEVTGNITVLPGRLHRIDDEAPDARIGTCGYPRTGIEIAILDGDDRPLPPRAQGEICVRGPAVFAGYYENPEATGKALRGGWFHTGDLGYLDEAGFLYITGRASDMYISGGSNIYPREIEELLLAHEGVVEAAVLGVPDPKWGEVGVAVCVRREDAEVDEPALLASLEGKLARYKLPRRVFFWDALPKSGYGKIPKHLIRAELERRGDLASLVETAR